MKRFLILALLIVATAFLALAAGEMSTIKSPGLNPRGEIQQLQAMIAQAKAAGQIPDPQWTARIEQLQALTTSTETAVAVAPVRPEVPKNDPLFAPPATMPAERPSTPLEQQIRQLEQQLFTTSSAAPVITPALKDQLNALYDQRPENHPMGQPIQRPETPLELQIHQLEEQFSRASGADAMALKQQISELYSQRPENRTRRNSLDQGGDNCSGATVITALPFHDTGTTVGYTDDFQTTVCGYPNGAPDVIYQLTAPHTGSYKISLCGSSFDTEIWVQTGGSCPGTTNVACNDDFCGLQSQVAVTLTQGVTYWIIVDGYWNYSGAYVLNVIDYSGDNCSTAIQIPGLPYTDVSSTDSLANDYNTNSSCTYTVNPPDRIYTFTPLYTGSHTISLCGSSYDTSLELRTGGVCPGTTQVACNDDACGLQSQVVVNLTAGTTYYVIVDGYYSQSGAYVLNISDDCSFLCQSYDLLECAETPSPTFGATDCDGGCNNTGDWNNPPNLFGLVLPDQTYCARGFTYVSPTGTQFRDTDWYQFTLSEPCVVQVNAISEFPLSSFILPAGCPAGAAVAQSSIDACGFMSYNTSDCIPAGDYYLWFGPSVFTGLATPRNYRFVLIESPCSGCVIDGTVLAPATVNGNTCGAVNNCSLRPSEDQTWRVNIPYESDWTFSLCGTTPNWDSYIYLTSQCCGGVIAQDDDGCGGVGVSVIRCAHLVAGSYYLTVEGYSSAGCGAYTLNITECLGRCCYGGADPSCVYVNPTACQALSGIFTLGADCGPGVCYIRPTCFPTSMYSQQPFLPNEDWDGYASDAATGYAFYDNFSGVTSPIGSLRFWGFRATSSLAACGENPMPFHIRFFQNNAGNVGTQVAIFNQTLSGTPGYIYHGSDNYPIIQYSTTLNPPVNLAAGWVSVVGDGDPACNFYWSTANSGDGTSWWTYNNGTPISQSSDFAMCVGPACMTTDTLVIYYDPTRPANRLDFHCTQTGTYRIFATTDHNAIYPNTFVQVSVGTVPPGHYTWYDYNVSPLYQRYVIVQDCGSEAPPSASVPFGQFVRVEPTVTPDAEQGNAGR